MHALVMRHVGRVVDLRPVGVEYALEVVTDEHVIPVGDADAAGRAARDEGANQAAEKIQTMGLFNQEAHMAFNLYTYWPTPSDYKQYLDERQGSTCLHDDVLAHALDVFKHAGPDARFRACHSMIISRYRKVSRTD